MKTIRLRVKAPTGDVLVSAPYQVPIQQIERFLVEHQAWVFKQKAQIAKLPERPPLNKPACQARLRREVPALIEHWQQQLGVRCEGWKTRRMKTRWGSCNIIKRTINLNLELGRMPHELLEYVVVHELVHLHERYHNQAFYAWLEKMLPDWFLREQQLNTYQLY